ncbi:hypothetical protein F5148DRAFT_973425 [Russula earlei]|uniref:Uncharacterized protein n=1 Tax=Russula earlei TaxID=71964 RepID=A0ACC0ULF5_9AGAM|nr:hypothetical protein F5148DRAFT_973425 [Russula earlei]
MQKSRAVVSNTTFDTSRADGGCSGSCQFSQGDVEQLRPQRQSSVISSLPLPSRAPAELVRLLGDKDGKLKAGFTVPPSDGTPASQKPVDVTMIERARPRPRVGLNIWLAGDTFVQGQTVSGQLNVHVRNTRSPVRMANIKLRAIGFESLADSPTFHVFYHYSCWIDEISYASEQVFSESPEYGDEDGYREAKEGTHVLPFEMALPNDPCFGKPKGVIDIRGAVVRYIIMASVNIKDADTNQLSLTHFYRTCSIWPSFSIHDVLVPSTRPLVSTAAMTLSQRDLRRKLKLSARVPRPYYFSGQRCYVHIQITNDTHKSVRLLRLTLIRTTTMYRPQSGKANCGDERDDVFSSSRTKSFIDEMSESRLTMAERTTRGCASSKGWWAGVGPQERTAFTFNILIPPDALSIARTELLAVDYAIRITIYVSASTLGLNSQLSITLPIRVLSMLSVDPPTFVSHPPNTHTITRTNGPDGPNGLCLQLPYSAPDHRVDSPPTYRTRPLSLAHPQDNDCDTHRQKNVCDIR